MKIYLYLSSNLKIMKINLKEIIAQKELETDKLAGQLFPDNKYPKLALNRVLSEETNLDEVQISKLASIIGCSIDELYTKRDWSGSQNKEGVYSFEKEGYRVELDSRTFMTKIYAQDSLLHEAVIHKGSILLSEYLAQIDNIISKFK